MKQARKTHLFPAVVFGFVDQGEIMGTFASSATCDGRHGAETGVRAHDGEDLVFLREALRGLDGLARGALAVLDHEPESMAFSGDLHAAGLVELGHGHFRRVLARGADGGNVAAQLGDHADGQVRELLLSAGQNSAAHGEERGRGAWSVFSWGVSSRAL